MNYNKPLNHKNKFISQREIKNKKYYTYTLVPPLNVNV